MKTRVFAAILALLMLLAVLPAVADTTDYTLRIDGGETAASVETVGGATCLKVEIFLDGITDEKLLASANFDLNFDSSLLAFHSYVSGELQAVDATGANLGNRSVFANGEAGRVRIGFASDYGCRLAKGKPFVTVYLRVKKSLGDNALIAFTASDIEAESLAISELVPGDDVDLKPVARSVGTSFSPFLGAVTVQDGWVVAGDEAFYYVGGEPSHGWVKVDGKWFFFDKDGALVTGWLLDDGKWYYLEPAGESGIETGVTGTIFRDGWRKVDGRWYFFNPGGHIARNTWKEIPDKSGTWYYFSAGGQMVTGWQKLGKSWYLFNPGGTLVTGWRKTGQYWYYLGTGAMRTGWQELSGKWYYFRTATENPEGAMVTGDYTIKGKLYHFDANGVWIPD